MSGWKSVLGKQTWIGFAIGIGSLLLFLAIGAWLCAKGIIPLSFTDKFVYCSWCIASIIGVCIATGNSKKLAAKACILALTFCMAILFVGIILFKRNGFGGISIGVIGSIWIGAILGMLAMASRKKKPVKRTVRK